MPRGSSMPGEATCSREAACPGGGQHTRKSSILRGSSMLGEHHNMVLKASFHEIEEHFVSGFECDNQLQILLGTAHRKRVQERWCITVTLLPCNTLALLWNGVEAARQSNTDPSFRNFFWEGCCVCGVIVCFKINPCG